MQNKVTLTTLYLLVTLAGASAAEALAPALQTKIDARIKDIQAWAAEPVLVNAVKAHNAALPADSAAMSQDKWKTLTVLDPFVRSFSKNEPGTFLKSRQTDVVSEAFLSGAEGMKVAFLAKPSSWSHKGKAKHGEPMSGKVWQGPVEVDESTGLPQVQVAVPVMDNGKPIGSLVVGMSVSKLEK